MMKLSLVLAASFALAAPVLAQPPSGRTDWTKPVTGVDAPVVTTSAEDRTLAVTVELISTKASPNDAGPPKPPPCEPPAMKSSEAALPPPCAPPAN